MSRKNLMFGKKFADIDFDAQNFIDAIGTLTTLQEDAIKDLVTGLKANGTWSKYDAIYPFIGGTADSHKWNLKDPRDLDVAFRLTYNATVTHDANGILGDGAAGHADTHYIVPLETTHDNFSWSLYSVTDTLQDDIDFGFQNSSGRVSTHLGWSDGYFVSDLYTAATGTGRTKYLVGNTDAYFQIVQGGSDHRAFKNGVQKDINTTDSSASFSAMDTDVSLGICDGTVAYNGASIRKFAFATIGDYLTPTEVADDYTTIQAYQTALSRQV